MFPLYFPGGGSRERANKRAPLGSDKNGEVGRSEPNRKKKRGKKGEKVRTKRVGFPAKPTPPAPQFFHLLALSPATQPRAKNLANSRGNNLKSFTLHESESAQQFETKGGRMLVTDLSFQV